MKPMKSMNNFYYFLAGCVFILYTIGHVYQGEVTAFAFAENSGLAAPSASILFYVWHVGTVSLLMYAAAFFVFAYARRPAATVMAAWLILALTTGQLLVFIASFVYIQPEALYGLVPPVVTWVATIYLQYLGISEARSYEWSETINAPEE
ncbi:MAG: hypothetical protein COA42_09930 [Alteromonadaceae bacterium]|nr:MAG: hypothetical protein COA42_09930 [Alteromonadaceae bacterium]